MNRRNFLKNTLGASIGLSLLPTVGFSHDNAYEYIKLDAPVVMLTFKNEKKYYEKAYFTEVINVLSLENFMEDNKDNIVFLYKHDQQVVGGHTFKYIRAFTLPKDYLDISTLRVNTNPPIWKSIKK